MAEFSPELEDGERWLPANILNDVGVRRRPSPLPFPAPSDGRGCLPRLAYLQALARELASLGPFHRHDVSTSPVFPPSPHYFVFGVPPTRSVNNAVRSGAVRDRFMAADVGGGCASSTPSLRSVQMRVGSDRFPPLQSHCSAFCEVIDPRKRPFGASKTGITHRPAPSIRGQFASIPTAGPAREKSGTGVFIPRVKIEKVNAARDVTGCREQSEKKEASSNGPEKERVKLKPLPPPVELGLPRDWTY